MAAINLLLFLATSASTQHRADGSVMVYGDDDHVLVVSPTVAGSTRVGPVSASAHVTLDIISAASVDLVTSASPGGYDEQRTEVGAGVGLNLGPGHEVDVSYGWSGEPDYETHSLSVGHAIDLLGRRATLAASYGFARSRVGRKNDSVFEEHKDTHRADLTWSHALTRDVALDVSYGLSIAEGFQANPYRFVRLYEPGAPQHATAVPETAPDERIRNTATLRVRSRLTGRLFGIADYRFYGDSWGVLAHTATLRASLGLLGDALTLTAETRGTVQGAASFYRERYETLPSAPELRTADKELGGLWSLLGGLHAEYTLSLHSRHALRLGVGADVVHFRYLDFEFLTGRTAFITTADLSWEM